MTPRRAKLADVVFEKIKERILAGDYAQGSLLPTQEDLAAGFGVSRTVMRDAFQKLSSLGLIEIRQGKGSFVKSATPLSIVTTILGAFHMDESWIRDLMEARYSVERSIVRLAALRASDEDLAELEENIGRMESAVAEGNLGSFAGIDLEFHRKLAEISRNKVLRETVDAIRGVMENFFDGFSKTPGVAPRALDYHREIFRALRNRDPEAAEMKLREHLGDICRNLKSNYGIDILL